MAKKKVAVARKAVKKKAAKKRVSRKKVAANIEAAAPGTATAESVSEGAVRQHQQFFEGEGFPEPPPKEVCDARDRYLDCMRQHSKVGKKKAELHERLIEVMHDHGVDRIPLDGENKYFMIEPVEKVKTKTVPKSERDKRKQEGD